MKDYLNMIVKNPNHQGNTTQSSSVHSTINSHYNKQVNHNQYQ